MLLATYFFFSSTVLQAQSLLSQNRRFQFADPGNTAKITCALKEKAQGFEFSFSWYRRREGELPLLIKTCNDKKITDKFGCRAEERNLILEIDHVQKEDSGLYLCAERVYGTSNFSTATSLIVGASQSVQSDHLACVVHGASNLVQVSWSISGDLQQEGWTLLAKNSSGSLTFISLLSVPMVDSQTSGKLYTCEVRFNSSGKRVKKSAPFPAASSADPPGSVDQCTSYKIPLAVGGLLALLLLLLSFLWIRLCPSGPGFQPQFSEPPASEALQEGICYAQLDFSSRNQDGNKKRRASQGRPLMP
ncbi:uncharacterized protein LOC128337475 isoform X2 [Hemicordylus capensis]|uniref:uncharacterized protein LOC128337475 isoform X2 n=1 Tax=Hemicordylus capensis TaxID=884348 RepID=UPI002303C576|nr:uncharacterized protein LOC128337475 isoform X2 [Hemicordylus capensis]